MIDLEKRLVKRSNSLAIANVALQCGFNRQKRFSKRFRAAIGVTISNSCEN